MKFEKLNVLFEMAIIYVFTPLSVSACTKKEIKKSSVMDATTTKRGLDEDHSKCEGNISYQ